MKTFGLTGGIGAGKTQAASLFKERGIPVFNLDDLGRDVTLSDTALIAEIERLCGTKVTDDGGALDRRKVREVLFRDASVRRAVEGVLHPRILQRFEDEVAKANARVVLCEAALLVESGYHKRLDGIIVVSAPVEVRKGRLMARDKISSELADGILRAQVSEEQRRAAATWVLLNDSDLTSLTRQVDLLIAEWKFRLWV